MRVLQPRLPNSCTGRKDPPFQEMLGRVVPEATVEKLGTILRKVGGRHQDACDGKNRALSSFRFSSRVETGAELTGVQKAFSAPGLESEVSKLKRRHGVFGDLLHPPHPHTR